MYESGHSPALREELREELREALRRLETACARHEAGLREPPRSHPAARALLVRTGELLRSEMVRLRGLRAG